SPEGKIPELKRVIVAYQSQIVMAETLKLALIQIFGQSIAAALPQDRLQGAATSVVQAAEETSSALVGADATLAQLAAEAQVHWDPAQKALRDGDFALYGDESKRVGELLQKMSPGKK